MLNDLQLLQDRQVQTITLWLEEFPSLVEKKQKEAKIFRTPPSTATYYIKTESTKFSFFSL